MQLKYITELAIQAGEEIMKVYNGESMGIETKEDDSPLTRADKRAHAVIAAGLEKAYPLIPILSEEGEMPEVTVRQAWKRFWLVDPLDGTKEFIKKNGEFTVNIALIEEGKPVLSCIYAPALDTLYVAEKGAGSWKIENAASRVLPDTAALLEAGDKLPNQEPDGVAAVVSRSHLSEATEQMLEELEQQFEQVTTISAGSSLKLCLIAEGKADFYPRMAPTMEWDIGAGQLIVEEAGGAVVVADSKQKMEYNKDELLNPYFIAKSAWLLQHSSM
ncbi:3'(2'),5'-bisphosphate nucleotidase CysQ [Alkalicoccus daliensis]|uniref:3'(2'),5'-bisphosphate nucleotidase CysQ n=1 Tax=Alkalicoccus daliensis TaxID=745820 RepID=A0A1H0FVC8_9BACI|nr:3'(2'),5'-bisphosphate nucleotidase CysQ [Alkalicoccus daliensis]SDN98606.1 3'(2'), 5'-bisphosphate nucleotidase [Alkalicoccus daliensis]